MEGADTHRERILHRVLRKNFMGASVSATTNISSKIEVIEPTADVRMERTDSNKSRIWMDYGDRCYTFDIIYNVRMREGSKLPQYVVSGID